MNVGRIELVFYWRLVIVFWATAFLSAIMLNFWSLFLWQTAQDVKFGIRDHALVIVLLSALITLVVMYFGSFVWWPLVVLWHWAIQKLRLRFGFLRAAVGLVAAMAFVISTLAFCIWCLGIWWGGLHGTRT